jgi:hypothetical protein
MNQVFYIVLGAVLALIGGILTQLYQNLVDRGREDRELLHKSLDILIVLGPILDGLPAARADIEKPCRELFFSARRIQTRKYRQLAEKLIEFALKDARHTRDDWDSLMDEIVENISKPFFGYHKKEKEIFKKAAREMIEASRQ